MTGYTKLFGSIVGSTIWQEDDETRLVWITMLAMANQFGEVMASIPGLASFAKVSIPATEAALVKLKAPDPYSRTKDFDGRRIEEIDGGWAILNHAKYRAAHGEDDRREQARLRAKRFRERVTQRNETSRTITQSNAKQKHIQNQEAEAEAEASVLEKSLHVITSYNRNASLLPLVKEVFDAWNALGPPIPQCLLISDKRRRQLEIRLGDMFWKANWKTALAKIKTAPFLVGDNERGWKAGFDFFIRPDTVTSIIEGKYDGTNRKNHQQNPRNFNSNAGRASQYAGIGKIPSVAVSNNERPAA